MSLLVEHCRRRDDVQRKPGQCGDPLPAGFVDEIRAAGADLAGVSLLDELGQTMPGLGTNPGMLLGLHEPFGRQLAGRTRLATRTRWPTPSMRSMAGASSSPASTPR